MAASLAGSGDACYLERMAADSKTLAGWLPGHDARWVIATVLVVAGLLWMQSDGLNGRMDDLNGRMDDLNGRMDDLNGRMDDLRRDVNNQIAELRIDLRRIDDRLRAVEIAVRPAVPTPGD